MLRKNPYFVHWRGSPDIEPFVDYLSEVGVLKFSGIRPHSHEMHYHDGIEIHFVAKGTYQWKVEDKLYQIYPGEGFITCPWEYHGSQAEVIQRGVLGWIIIRPEIFTRNGTLKLGEWSSLSGESQSRIGRIFAENTNPVLSKGNNLGDLFHGLNEEMTRKDLGYREKVGFLLDSLLLTVARSLKNREKRENIDCDFVNRLSAQMNHLFSGKVLVEDLALQFGMSASSFNTKVKTLTGFSPGEYLIELKLKKAKEMLLRTNRSITYIANECGFSSSQYFSRTFLKRVGITPKTYRDNFRKRSS